MVPLCGVCNNVGLTEMVVVDVVVHIVYSFYVVIYPDGPFLFIFFFTASFPPNKAKRGHKNKNISDEK